MSFLLPIVASGVVAIITFLLGLGTPICVLAAAATFPSVHLLLIEKQQKPQSRSSFLDEEDQKEAKKEAKRQKRIEEAKRKAVAKVNTIVEKTEKATKDAVKQVVATTESDSDDDSDEDVDSKKLSKSAAKKAKKKKAEQERKRQEEEERKRQEEEKKKEEAKKKKAAKKASKTGSTTSTTVTESAPVEVRRSQVSEEDGWQNVRNERSSSHKNVEKAKAAAAAAADAKKGGKSTTGTYVPETVEEMFIPFKSHGLLIGVQGETLKQLSAGTGARIEIPKKESGSTKVQIIGDAAQVAHAKAAINSLLTHGYSTITHPGTVHDDLHVDPKDFGLVIGPKGAYLKAITTKTNTRINFPDKASASERVTILGKKEDVRAARLAIKELIADGYSALTHEGQVKREIDFPHDKLHLLVGPKGQTIKSIQGNSGTKINIPDRNTTSGVIIVGSAEGVAHAERQINKLLTPPTIVEEEPEEEYVNGTWANTQTNEDDLW